MKGTIYYLIPNLYSNKIVFKDLLIALKRGRPFEYIKNQRAIVHKPVGGIKVFYQHCLLLKELGYQAYPLILGDYVGNFFGYDLELKYLKDVGYHLTPDDIVVSTEFTPYDGLQFKSAKKVLFMQNWINIGERFKKADIGKSYIDLGYDQVITCGDYCSEMVNKRMNIPAVTITNGIDQEKFFPAPERRVARRVLALSRKKAADLATIMDIVKDHGIEFKVVDKLTQSQLIEEYQQADIFLATGYPEGLPLPPLEAMNCGCAVVGFTGGGAREYMIDQETALVAEDGDCSTAAKKLLDLINNPNLKETIRANGMAAARKYTLENTKQKIAEFYSSFN